MYFRRNERKDDVEDESNQGTLNAIGRLIGVRQRLSILRRGRARKCIEGLHCWSLCILSRPGAQHVVDLFQSEEGHSQRIAEEGLCKLFHGSLLQTRVGF